MERRDDNDNAQHADTAATHEPGHRDAPATKPDDDAKAQAEKIIKRNKDLVHGDAEASHEGEREVGVGQTVNSDTSHRGGDYASD